MYKTARSSWGSAAATDAGTQGDGSARDVGASGGKQHVDRGDLERELDALAVDRERQVVAADNVMVGQDVTVLGDDEAAAAADLDLIPAGGFVRAFDGCADSSDEPDEDCRIGRGARALGCRRRLEQDSASEGDEYHAAGSIQAATDELHGLMFYRWLTSSASEITSANRRRKARLSDVVVCWRE